MRGLTKPFPLLAPVALLFALVSQYGFGKLPVAQPHLLPVDSFPRTIGSWMTGVNVPVDSEVQAKLPSAKIVERVYFNPTGKSVDLTLVSASDNLDIHDPATCLPSQGWKILDRGTSLVGNQDINVMHVMQDGQAITVFYWFTGYFPKSPPKSPIIRSIAKLRNRVIGRREADSLLVRLMTNTNPDGDAVLRNFVRLEAPSIQDLLNARRRWRVPSGFR